MAKGITYEELMELAKEYYYKGGDVTYECCDRKWFEQYVKMFGKMTKKEALEMFSVDYDREQDAKNIW